MNEPLVSKKYFIGKVSKGVWSSVYTYRPHNPDLRGKRGEVFAVILLKGPESFALGTAGGLLLDRFHETYFENRTDTVLIALEKAAKETSKYLQKMLEHDQADKDGVDLNLCALTIIEDLVYVLLIGEGKVYVYREDELNEISNELKDPTGEGIVKEASFIAKKADVYLIGTNEVDKQINKQEIIKASEEFSDTPFKNRIYDDESSIALMLIGFNIDRRPKAVKEAEILKDNEEVNKIEEEEKVVVEKMIEDENEKEDIVDNDKVEEEEDLTLEELVSREQEVNIEEKEEDDISEPLPKAEEEDIEEVFEEAEKVTEIENKSVVKIGKFDSIKRKVRSMFSRVFKKKEPQFDRLAKINIDRGREDMKTYQVILLKIKDGIIGFLVGLKSLVWDKWLGLGMNTDDMYLRSAARKRRYGFLAILIIIVIAILYSSIKGAVENQKIKEQEELANVQLAEIETMVLEVEEQAQYLVAASGADERKVKALATLDNVEIRLTELSETGFLASEIALMNERIDMIRNKFNRIISLNEVNIIADLGDTFPGASPSDIAIRNQKVYISDSKFGTIYSYDYAGNNRAEIGSGFVNPKSIAVDDDNNTLIVLDDNPDNALSIINLANNSLSKMAASSQSKLSGTSVIETALINAKEPRLYLLNPANKSMSYYIRSGSTYGTLILRNNSDDIATATDFKIDEGRIYYTMQKNMGLFKDYNKAEDKINILNMSEGDNFLSATSLYVDGQYVYVGDSVNRRVLVFLKGAPDISLIAQYKYEGSDENIFKNIKEVTADRMSNKIFVLDGSRIMVLDMNILTDFTIN